MSPSASMHPTHISERPLEDENSCIIVATRESSTCSNDSDDMPLWQHRYGAKTAGTILGQISPPASSQTDSKMTFTLRWKDGHCKIPSHEIKNRTILEFLCLCSKISDIDVIYFQRVRFVAIFAREEWMEVSRTSLERDWMALKRRFSDLYSLTRLERPTMVDFEVSIDIIQSEHLVKKTPDLYGED